jgi:hypothetical protein
LPHNEKQSRTFVADTDYLGTIQADTLIVTPSFTEEEVFGDLRGPNNSIDSVLFPGDETINFTLIEVNRNAVKRLVYPFSTTGNSTIRTDAPGVSGEGPQPGRLRSSYEGILRLVPFTGNLSFWDNDFNPNIAGLSVKHYFHVMLAAENDLRENYKAGLLALPVTLRARVCRDTVTGQWRTHTFVPSLTHTVNI